MFENRKSRWILGTLGGLSVFGAAGLATASPSGAAPSGVTPTDCTAGSTATAGTCTLYTPNGTFHANGSVT